MCVCCDNSGVICSVQRIGLASVAANHIRHHHQDTEYDLFGVRDDLGPEDTDVRYFDTLDDYPPDWI